MPRHSQAVVGMHRAEKGHLEAVARVQTAFAWFQRGTSGLISI